jgi:hypothetical protein
VHNGVTRHNMMSQKKLMENCNMQRGEVAVGDHTSSWCCGLVSNERWLAKVFSRGAHGDR